MKIVINKCFGGFGLSHEATMEIAKRKGITLYPWLDEIATTVYGEITIEQAVAKHCIISYTTVPKKEHNEGGTQDTYFYLEEQIERTDAELVAVVEEMGDLANGWCAELAVVEVPDGIEWELDEYDGMEHVAETHRTWG